MLSFLAIGVGGGAGGNRDKEEMNLSILPEGNSGLGGGATGM